MKIGQQGARMGVVPLNGKALFPVILNNIGIVLMTTGIVLVLQALFTKVTGFDAK